MRTLHRYLVTEGERPDDPTAELEGVHVPAGLPKPLSEEEIGSLLDAVVGTDPVAVRDRALLELLYATGARISEACGLSIGDIDIDPVSCGCTARAPRNGSSRSDRATGAALDSGSRPHRSRALLVPDSGGGTTTPRPCS